MLHKLEAEGCIRAYEKVVDGRRRRYYSITRKGKEQLARERTQWETFSAAVTQILGGRPWRDLGGGSPMKTEIFLDRVVQHVRFRPDRGAVRRELAGHLDDSAAALQQAEGMDAETAYAQAVENMGDPDEIGRALDRAHSPLLGWTWLVSKVLCIAVCVFLGAPLVLGQCGLARHIAYNLAEYSRANVEFEAPVDTWIDVGETLKLGRTAVAIDWVARLENGNVCVKYHTYRVGRAAWQIVHRTS